jgi:uncharacterized protein YaaR (DUF327 family)
MGFKCVMRSFHENRTRKFVEKYKSFIPTFIKDIVSDSIVDESRAIIKFSAAFGGN